MNKIGENPGQLRHTFTDKCLPTRSSRELLRSKAAFSRLPDNHPLKVILRELPVALQDLVQPGLDPVLAAAQRVAVVVQQPVHVGALHHLHQDGSQLPLQSQQALPTQTPQSRHQNGTPPTFKPWQSLEGGASTQKVNRSGGPSMQKKTKVSLMTAWFLTLRSELKSCFCLSYCPTSILS